MPEIREIPSQQVDQRCEKCRDGWMRPTGIVNMTNPPSYQHKCTSCQHTQTYGVRYPYIVSK